MTHDTLKLYMPPREKPYVVDAAVWARYQRAIDMAMAAFPGAAIVEYRTSDIEQARAHKQLPMPGMRKVTNGRL